jgi:hypothetical protein
MRRYAALTGAEAELRALEHRHRRRELRDHAVEAGALRLHLGGRRLQGVGLVLELHGLLLELLVGHLELGRLVLELLVGELQFDGVLLQARGRVPGFGGVRGGRVPGRAQRRGERADEPGDEHEHAERDQVGRVGRPERARRWDQVVVDPEHAQERGDEPGPDPAVPRGDRHGAERDDEERVRDHRRQRDRERHGARREDDGRGVAGRRVGRGAGRGPRARSGADRAAHGGWR